jgi:hypothetical protein
MAFVHGSVRLGYEVQLVCRGATSTSTAYSIYVAMVSIEHNSVYAQVQHSSQARVVPRMVDLYPDSG